MNYIGWHNFTKAVRWWRSHPVLGPATATLAALRDASERFPGSWVYFGEPALAASALAALIQGDDTARYDRSDATPEAMHAALQPVIKFRAAHGLNFPVTSALPATADLTPRARGRHDDSNGHRHASMPASSDPVHGHTTDRLPARPDRPGTGRAPEVS
jgi:hypothetical protein